MKTLKWLTGFFLLAWSVQAAAPANIALPAPRMEGGKPLMQVLKERQSSRTFAPNPLPDQVLSDLLWVACGINRPDSGKRTAPSGHNQQEIEIYVFLEKGVYLYDAQRNLLKGLIEGDLRTQTGMQPYVGTAPLNLVFVADYSKFLKTPEGDRDFYASADAGFISQNVHLFCTSEGLATVSRGSVDREELAKTLGLPPHKKIVFAHTAGYPADK